MEMRAYIYMGFKLFETILHFIQLDSYVSQDKIAFVVMTNHSRISFT